MSIRKFWQEILGMNLYETKEGQFFYAWGWEHAQKKMPGKTLYLITKYGERIHIRGT